jgi:hypothetical protein
LEGTDVLKAGRRQVVRQRLAARQQKYAVLKNEPKRYRNQKDGQSLGTSSQEGLDEAQIEEQGAGAARDHGGEDGDRQAIREMLPDEGGVRANSEEITMSKIWSRGDAELQGEGY